MQYREAILMESSFSPHHTPTRKSFRSHQEIRRNCMKPILCASAFLLLLFCLPVYYFSPQLNNSPESRLQQNKPFTAKATETYFRTYCKDRGACQEESIEALTAILALMEHTYTPRKLPSTAENVQIVQEGEETGEPSSQTATNGSQIGQFTSRIYNIEKVKLRSGRSRLSQLPLQVMRHPKVTTPAALSFVEQLASLFANRDPYHGIDQIVEKDSGFVWIPNTAAVSIGVRSNSPIKPTTVEVILERVEGGTGKLELIGLSVTVQQRAVLSILGTHEVRRGTNRINCMAIECEDLYDALIFKMGSVDVSNIKVFSSIVVMNSSQ